MGHGDAHPPFLASGARDLPKPPFRIDGVGVVLEEPDAARHTRCTAQRRPGGVAARRASEHRSIVDRCRASDGLSDQRAWRSAIPTQRGRAHPGRGRARHRWRSRRLGPRRTGVRARRLRTRGDRPRRQSRPRIRVARPRRGTAHRDARRARRRLRAGGRSVRAAGARRLPDRARRFSPGRRRIGCQSHRPGDPAGRPPRAHRVPSRGCALGRPHDSILHARDRIDHGHRPRQLAAPRPCPSRAPSRQGAALRHQGADGHAGARIAARRGGRADPDDVRRRQGRPLAGRRGRASLQDRGPSRAE